MSELFTPSNRLAKWLERPLSGEMAQIELPLIARLDGPALVQPEWIGKASSYREACRYAWAGRRVRNMTRAVLAAEAELYAAHISDYLHPDDKPSRRSLPADAIARFESVVGNTFVSQWLARQASLTVLEEMQAMRRAA